MRIREIVLAAVLGVGATYIAGCDPPQQQVQQEQVQKQSAAEAEPKIDQDYLVRTGLEKIIGEVVTKQGIITRIDYHDIPYMWKNDNDINGVRQIEILFFQTIGGTSLKLAYLFPESFEKGDATITYFPLKTKGNELTHSNIISGGFKSDNNNWVPAIQNLDHTPYEPRIHAHGIIGNYENIQYVR